MSTPSPPPPPHPVASSPTGTGGPAAHLPAPASRLPSVVGAVAIVALVAVVAYFVISGWGSESTDDAYVTAHLTTVIAKVPAYVQTLHIDDNAAVKAGQLLVELDPRDYVVEVEIARSNLEAAVGRRKEADVRVDITDADAAQARAELAVARANATLADANLKRLRSVSDARAISNERVDTGVAAADSTRASVTAAET